MIGNAAGRAYVRRMGEQIVVVERTATRDEASNWDDEQITTTDHEVTAIVERVDRGEIETNAAESGRARRLRFTLRDDAPVYLDDTRDDGNADLPTLIRHRGAEYVTVTYEPEGNGTVVVAGERV